MHAMSGLIPVPTAETLRLTDCSRRQFLAATAATALWPWLGLQPLAAEDTTARPLRVAAINSVYWLRSHAYHICGRLIHGYTWNGVHHQPNLQLVRMYNHLSPKNDIGPRICQQHGIQLCDSIPAALGGPNGVDVDAILLIIEHGDYPVNDRNQVLYPRYEMFQAIVDVLQSANKTVPIFIDKHLSYDHRLATRMIETARARKIPLMAGSSLPVTWRTPDVEPPLESPFTEGVVTYGFDRGAIDIYLFHALESLQVFMERRRGGESGVQSVQMLRGDAVWRAAAEGQFSLDLMHAALANCQSLNVGSVRDNVSDPLAVLVKYRDGTRGCVLNLIEQTSEFGFAGRIAGQPDPVACCLYLPSPPAANFFNPLTYHIEQFFRSGKASYPVERTWLTTTMTDLALQSLADSSRVLDDPALGITYTPPAESGHARGSWTNAVRS
jgi:hypothetical protein